MAKITFTPAQKAKAMKLLNEHWTAAEVCEEIGCSPASLQNWKKEFKEGKISLSDLPLSDEEDDEAEKTPPQKASHTPSHYSSSAIRTSSVSREDFVRDYWKHKSVDTVMDSPKTIDEAIKRINSALVYAYDYFAG